MRSRSSLAWELLRRRTAPSRMLTLLSMRQALSGCRTVLDVGCGPDSSLSLFGLDRLVGIEGYAPYVETARRNRTHHEVVLGDARHLENLFQPGQFDACIAVDVIEHLTKKEGWQMVCGMEKIASRRVVLLTPNGYLNQGHTEQSDLQEHQSGWQAEEMRNAGYRVAGMVGPKALRGEYHALQRRPYWFWGLLSLFGHLLWTRWHPEAAAAILCVKSK